MGFGTCAKEGFGLNMPNRANGREPPESDRWGPVFGARGKSWDSKTLTEKGGLVATPSKSRSLYVVGSGSNTHRILYVIVKEPTNKSVLGLGIATSGGFQQRFFLWWNLVVRPLQ